jgi:predicted nucleic acid-binding protein
VKLYLETTIPNFLYHDDAPEKQRVTIAFFKWLRICTDDLYISTVVEDEIHDAPEPKRERMLRALAEIPVQVLEVPPAATTLAKAYLTAGVWTERSATDALHVATAACHKLDVIVSWNMKDLANVRRVIRINEVNAAHGFGVIRIATPEELLES